MVVEENTNAIAVTDLLVADFPLTTKAIRESCTHQQMAFHILGGAADYWCRDFMPVPVSESKYIQFAFDPPYYKSRKYQHLKTDLTRVQNPRDSCTRFCELRLDGGNLIYASNSAFITDQVFADNTQFSKTEITKRLRDLLELDRLDIIPALPGDITCHADGMVRMVNENTLLINDLSRLCSSTYCKQLMRGFGGYTVFTLPNDLHLNARKENETGDYINFLRIGTEILMPVYGTQTDDEALEIVGRLFNQCKVVPVMCSYLARKGGLLHCATWNYID